MAKSQLRARRKVSGGRYVDYRKKKLRDISRDPTLTKIGVLRKKTLVVRGGNLKTFLLTSDVANVLCKDKKYKTAKIKIVVDNPANRHYARRNILTKGSIIETELGRARITSRPGQEGCINAVLL